ncbi:MAG: DUF6629 family protein [Bacteroidia bacterium]
MCFSATASFSAGAILAIVGVASLKKVQTSSQFMFALFPVFFSIQQFTEGAVWISLTNTNYQYWKSIPIYIFVFFAQIFWTIWVPLSFYLMEKNRIRKKILFLFVAIGSAISLFHFYNFIFFDVTASIKPYHIYYDLDFPLRHNLIMEVLYLLVIIVPALISSIHRTYLLGILLFTSFLITNLYFKDYIISVWCFFSALISILVYAIMKDLKEEDQLRKIAF